MHLPEETGMTVLAFARKKNGMTVLAFARKYRNDAVAFYPKTNSIQCHEESENTF
jgi:hypothetical protein